MVNIAYLGGKFSAEYSLAESIRAAGNNITFLVDESVFSNRFFKPQYAGDRDIVKISQESLAKHLRDNKVDVVIHRYYMRDPVMHPLSYESAKEAGIPLIRYAQETDLGDTGSCTGDNYDALIYAHDTKLFTDHHRTSTKPFFFYPYGVGPLEMITGEEKKVNVGMIGQWRKFASRNKNIEDFANAVGAAGEKLHVYGYSYRNTLKDNRHVVINQEYEQRKSTDIINLHKITVNAETLNDEQNAYSHKLWQSLGCGVPVITWHKAGLENIFGNHDRNLIMVSTYGEATDWIRRLMSDDRLMKQISQEAYEYTHERLDWWKRLEPILNSVL